MGPATTAPARPGPPPPTSAADRFMCRVLCVPAERAPVGEASVQRLFNVSILISALRCLLSYVVFPIVTPALGVATGVGPAIGLPIAVVALGFDVAGIRRFWLAGHRWRWPMTALYLCVMGLVSALLVGDVRHLVA